jgi:putative two-component system response regulator
MAKKAATVLIVDDEPHICELLFRWLTAEGHECTVAFNGDMALELLEGHEFDLMISDIMMPGMSGIDLLKIVMSRYPETAVVMVTAVDDRRTGILTLELGAYGYIIKPFEKNEIIINIANALERRNLTKLEHEYERNLAEHLRRCQAQVSRHDEVVLKMISAAGRRHGETDGHLQRVGRYSLALAKAVGQGWTLSEIEMMQTASAFHDVGKVAIPDHIWLKAEKLDPGEIKLMRSHSELGARLLSEAQTPLLVMAKEIALAHHERWDGSGYPRGISGEAIPQTARIVAVAEVFDALLHRRTHRPAYSEEEALSIMREESGAHFDPTIFDTFVRMLPDLRRIGTDFPDEDW